MYKYCFIFTLFFTISNAIICPTYYKNNLCLKLIGTEDRSEEQKYNNIQFISSSEIQTADYCLQCTYQYRKCEENENSEDLYCNPINGLCELNETEFENLFVDDEKIYTDFVCINITKNNNSNKDVETALICVIVILFVVIVILFCVLMHKFYMYERKKNYENNRKELENVYYINKSDNESEDLKTVSISDSETDFENDEEENIKAVIF